MFVLVVRAATQVLVVVTDFKYFGKTVGGGRWGCHNITAVDQLFEESNGLLVGDVLKVEVDLFVKPESQSSAQTGPDGDVVSTAPKPTSTGDRHGADIPRPPIQSTSGSTPSIERTPRNPEDPMDRLLDLGPGDIFANKYKKNPDKLSDLKMA